MNDNSAPFASFYFKGPDADGEVWLLVDTGEKQRAFNLGPPEGVAEKLSQWLAAYDDGKRFT